MTEFDADASAGADAGVVDAKDLYFGDLAEVKEEMLVDLVDVGACVGATSAPVTWLDTPEQYVVTQTDVDCRDRRCVHVHHVCWLEMGWYEFPPPEAAADEMSPGRYFLVQRIKSNQRATLAGNLKYYIRGDDSGVITGGTPPFPDTPISDDAPSSGLRLPSRPTPLPDNGFQIPRLTMKGDDLLAATKSSGDWLNMVVGWFDLKTSCKVRLRVFGSDSSYWKSGLFFDYFQLLFCRFKPEPLQSKCLKSIVENLEGREPENLRLPTKLKDLLEEERKKRRRRRKWRESTTTSSPRSSSSSAASSFSIPSQCLLA